MSEDDGREHLSIWKRVDRVRVPAPCPANRTDSSICHPAIISQSLNTRLASTLFFLSLSARIRVFYATRYRKRAVRKRTCSDLPVAIPLVERRAVPADRLVYRATGRSAVHAHKDCAGAELRSSVRRRPYIRLSRESAISSVPKVRVCQKQCSSGSMSNCTGRDRRLPPHRGGQPRERRPDHARGGRGVGTDEPAGPTDRRGQSRAGTLAFGARRPG